MGHCWGEKAVEETLNRTASWCQDTELGRFVQLRRGLAGQADIAVQEMIAYQEDEMLVAALVVEYTLAGAADKPFLIPRRAAERMVNTFQKRLVRHNLVHSD